MLCIGTTAASTSYHGRSNTAKASANSSVHQPGDSKRGDRLVLVDGRAVVNGESARELLQAAGEQVQLQLLRQQQRRHDGLLHYASLPGRRLGEESPQSPAAAAPDPGTAMGSNLSRHSAGSLSGRRSQSSGNLCNGNTSTSRHHALKPLGRFFSPCGREQDSVRAPQRYKLCGSLPNHLDLDDTDTDLQPPQNNNNEPALKAKTISVANQCSTGEAHLRFLHYPLGAAAGGELDQGYASGKSPDRPRLPLLTQENTFTVSLVKGSQGLGLSLAGGRDEQESGLNGGVWPPGLVRIKRLFPNQPACQSGKLRQGDILLSANKVPLTGLTNYEALEILRTTPSEVELTICRPPSEAIQHMLDSTAPAPAPPPPRRDPQLTSHLTLSLKQDDSFGEFDVVMTKVNGSLGFTLRKEDESVLGHYVRALVREPALSDGRIKPGDKIVAVNDVDMSQMTHEEAVMFLRQCGQEVRLRLYRDRAQTPVSALSPVQSSNSLNRKPMLRKEAQDMLTDLAVKKSQSQSPGDSTTSSEQSHLGRSASPRKRRGIKTPSPDSRLLNGSIKGDRLSFVGEKLQRPDTLALTGAITLQFQQLENGGVEDVELNIGEPLSMPPLSEPVSMPPLQDSSATDGAFSYRNPAYRSANPAAPKSSTSFLSQELPNSRFSDQDLLGGKEVENKGTIEGTKGLLKWKGVVFSPEEGTNKTPEDSISQIVEADGGVSANQVLVVELNRGWNSRLGFSLQNVEKNTIISAIYPDSVASRDGRLRPGDQLIMVNDENVEGLSTGEVIDLLRKIRGSICITVWRKPAAVVTSTQTSD